MDLLTLQMAKNYTDETAEGMGIQKGKNCQILSIEDITGGHRITFAWYDEDQVLKTDTVDIMNGDEGPEGPQGPQGEVGESGVGFGPVPEVMPEGVNWWIDPNGEPNTAATINDSNVSEDETWSSKKIDSKFGSNNIWDGVEEAGIINTSTGEDEESTNGRRMPHDKGITVVPGDTYYIKKTTTAKIRYTFYAADGTYIGNEDALGNTLVDTNVMSQKMIPPAGATQFRAFASSSLVSAGLTVSAGVGADIDEINGEISKINRDLSNILKFNHNAFYRGKNITADFDSGRFSASVANGSFDDIYIGDYIEKTITIEGTVYTDRAYVAHIDPYYAGYNNYSLVNTHHVGLVHVITDLKHSMNSTNTTQNGYAGSEMFTYLKNTVLPALQASFGSSHFVSHQKLYTNSVNTTAWNRKGAASGASSGWNWSTDQFISLMTEAQIYGTTCFSSSAFDTGESFRQLSIFALKNHGEIIGRKTSWLRDVGTATEFCFSSGAGCIDCGVASSDFSIIPLTLCK